MSDVPRQDAPAPEGDDLPEIGADLSHHLRDLLGTAHTAVQLLHSDVPLSPEKRSQLRGLTIHAIEESLRILDRMRIPGQSSEFPTEDQYARPPGGG